MSSNPYCEILTENINFFTKPGTQEMSFNGTDIIFFYSDPVHEVQNRGETTLSVEEDGILTFVFHSNTVELDRLHFEQA